MPNPLLIDNDYSLDGMKWLVPNIPPFDFVCPRCHTPMQHTDCLEIEYPKKNDSVGWWCETCNQGMDIPITITVKVEIEVHLDKISLDQPQPLYK